VFHHINLQAQFISWVEKYNSLGGVTDIVARVEEVAKKRGVSMAQVALAWPMRKDGAHAFLRLKVVSQQPNPTYNCICRIQGSRRLSSARPPPRRSWTVSVGSILNSNCLLHKLTDASFRFVAPPSAFNWTSVFDK
jgi:hypothetical protein